MEAKVEFELLKKGVEDLKNETHSGFQVLTKKIGELYDKLEERRVQNGKQDERIRTHDETIRELKDEIHELKKDYQKFIKENQEAHSQILVMLEKQAGAYIKQSSVYVKWLAGLTLSLIPVLIAVIRLFVKGG